MWWLVAFSIGVKIIATAWLIHTGEYHLIALQSVIIINMMHSLAKLNTEDMRVKKCNIMLTHS